MVARNNLGARKIRMHCNRISVKQFENGNDKKYMYVEGRELTGENSETGHKVPNNSKRNLLPKGLSIRLIVA